MSCLLYNLAIEPLLVNIRVSPLKGFNINEELTKVLVKTYADKTEGQFMVVHINIYVCTECSIVLPYITESLRLNS